MARRKKSAAETIDLSEGTSQTKASVLESFTSSTVGAKENGASLQSLSAPIVTREGSEEQEDAPPSSNNSDESSSSSDESSSSSDESSSSSDESSSSSDESSSEAPSGPVYVELQPNGCTNFDELKRVTPLEERNGKYYLLCTWGELFPDLIPAPAKEITAAPGVAIYKTGEPNNLTMTHTGSGRGIATLTEEIAGYDESTTEEEETPTLSSAYLKVVWLDDIDDSDSSSSDDSESSFATDCVVTFSVREPDGSVRIVKRAIFEEGTPISEVKEMFQATLDSAPSLSSGYWYFKGWSNTLDFPGLLTQDIVSWGQYEPARVSIDIDFNGATNPSVTPLVCTWGQMFSPITPAPVKNTEPCAGIFLTTIDSGRVITRTHTSDGNGVTIVSSREMGSQTVDIRQQASPQPIAVLSCNLVVNWSEPLKWNTQEDLRSAIGIIPTPFASDPSATIDIPAEDDASDSEEELNFKDGFPLSYTKPLINPETGNVNTGARVITRRQVNTLGYIGTQEQFFEQCGGYHTFDQAVCNAIGGYPESAVLRYYDADNNCLRTVYSLLDDNTWNFIENGVDGIHWKYVDNNPVLSLKIDYSDFIDLRDILFVETGQPDFYEIPFDGYLQLHALSFCDMNSILRDPEQEYAREVVSIDQYQDKNYATGTETWVAVPNYENVNGALETYFRGTVYLDVYNIKTNTTNSFYIRIDGAIGTHVSVWQATPFGPNGAYYQYKCPCYVVTQGGFFLNKGDKIRVRGSYTDKISSKMNWGGGEMASLGETSRVLEKVLSDKEVRRRYLTKFANFYRVGWEG